MIGHIDIGSSIDCEDLPQGGTRSRLILINFNDVLFVYDNGGIITSIIIQGGKVAYEFLGFRNDIKKSEEVVKLDNGKRRFDHHIDFIIYEEGQPQKTNIKNLTRGRFMAITETKGKTDNCIELLGRTVGLSVAAGLVRDSHENGGVFTLSLSTPGGPEYEKKLPQTVGETYNDGLQLIQELLTGGELLPTFDSTFVRFDSELFTWDNG